MNIIIRTIFRRLLGKVLLDVANLSLNNDWKRTNILTYDVSFLNDIRIILKI